MTPGPPSPAGGRTLCEQSGTIIERQIGDSSVPSLPDILPLEYVLRTDELRRDSGALAGTPHIGAGVEREQAEDGEATDDDGMIADVHAVPKASGIWGIWGGVRDFAVDAAGAVGVAWDTAQVMLASLGISDPPCQSGPEHAARLEDTVAITGHDTTTEVAVVVRSGPESSPRVRVFQVTLGKSNRDQEPPPPVAELSDPAMCGATCCRWRPHGGRALAIGCEGGVCLAALCGPDLAGSGAQSQAIPLGGAAVAGESAAGSSIRFLPSGAGSGVPVVCLAWSPCGRLLAGALASRRGLRVWDVARGSCAALGTGRRAVRLLRWSPGGGRLLAGLEGGTLAVFDTARWGREEWQRGAASAGEVGGAAWSPDGAAAIFCFEGTRHLAQLAFLGPPPSLAAQLAPLTPHELSYTLPEWGGDGAADCIVASLAWDPSGRRLAVAVRGNHPAAGQVALFSVTTGALIQSLTFVGWVVPPHHAEDPAVAVQFQEGGQKHAVLGALHASGRISLYPLFI